MKEAIKERAIMRAKIRAMKESLQLLEDVKYLKQRFPKFYKAIIQDYIMNNHENSNKG